MNPDRSEFHQRLAVEVHVGTLPHSPLDQSTQAPLNWKWIPLHPPLEDHQTQLHL